MVINRNGGVSAEGSARERRQHSIENGVTECAGEEEEGEGWMGDVPLPVAQGFRTPQGALLCYAEVYKDCHCEPRNYPFLPLSLFNFVLLTAKK